MAVKYRLYQNNNPKMSASYGKWYAHAAIDGTFNTDQLAELIQRNCSLKKSDVKGVIEELVEVLADQLAASKRVVINGLGSFKVGISSLPSDMAKDFTINRNIRGVRVIFQPETKISADGKRTKALLKNVKLEEMTTYQVDKGKKEP